MIGTDTQFEAYKHRILDKTKSLKIEIQENNLFAFKENCEDVMSGIIEEIEKSIDNGKIDSIEKLTKEFNNVEEK